MTTLITAAKETRLGSISSRFVSAVNILLAHDVAPVAIVFCIQPIAFCTWQAGDFLIGGKYNWLDQCSSRGVHGGTRAHKTAGQSSLRYGQLQQREQACSALMHFRVP